MNRFASLVVEALVVAAVAAGVGYFANSHSSKGLDLSKDYFFVAAKPEKPATPTANGKKEPSAATDPEAEAAARLKAEGIATISHDDVVKDFDDELYQKYDAYAFIDARNDANYADGHIPGAWHFDPYHVEPYTTTVVPQCQNSAKVIVYCNGGQCVDSELAAQHLVNLGVPKASLFVYLGGIQAWKKAGRSVEKGERKSGNLAVEKPDDG